MPNDIQPPDPGPRDIELTDVEDTDDAYHAGTPTPRTSRDPLDKGPGARARRDLSELAVRLRSDASQVADPRLHALLESSAEVLLGLAKAFADHPDTTESDSAPS
jgi:hypothetical protein